MKYEIRNSKLEANSNAQKPNVRNNMIRHLLLIGLLAIFMM